MSLKSRIKDVYPSFTNSEKVIADYFLEHESEVEKSSAKELAEKCGASAPTIVRFARTLGYSGFPALKMDLMMSDKREIEDLTQEMRQDESSENVISAAYSHRLSTIEKTKELIDATVVEDVVSHIEKAGSVYLCGIGGSGIVCEDLYQKLTRIGIRAVYSSDSHVNIASLSGMKENDVLIAISYSGETEIICESCRIAKKKGGFVTGISQLGKTELSKNADAMFFIPVHENTVRAGAIASRDSSLFVSDVIYLSLFSRHLDSNKQLLSDTKKWTGKI